MVEFIAVLESADNEFRVAALSNYEYLMGEWDETTHKFKGNKQLIAHGFMNSPVYTTESEAINAALRMKLTSLEDGIIMIREFKHKKFSEFL